MTFHRAWLVIALVALGCSNDEDSRASDGSGGSVTGGASTVGGAGGTGGSTGPGMGGTGAGGAGGSTPTTTFRCGDPRLPMATPSFAEAVVLEANQGTGGTASGDLDGDGRDEFVAQIQFKIYDWDGGNWTAHDILPNLDGRRNRFAGDIELADVDKDGDLDIVVPDSDNSGSQGAISWFENPGALDGSWQEHVVTTFDGNGAENSVEHLSELEVADIDANGWVDIVVRDISHGVWVLLQTDADTWAPRRFVATLPREGLRLWDPDENGRLDILLNGVWLETPPNPIDDDFILHPIIGMERWYAPDNNNNAVRDYACKVEVEDFNGDGTVDIAITNSEELAANSPDKPHGISVFVQPANPITDAWPEVQVTTDHFAWHTLMVADFDHDGSADLLTAISQVGQDNAGDEISLWLNGGDGSQFAAQTISTDATVYQGIIGDADGDGDCDLVAPDHFNAGPIRYFANTTAPAAQ